jgi:hypothetical protein
MRRFILRGLMAVMVFILCQVGPAAAYTWYNWNGHSYALSNNYNSWTVVENEAVTAGGHLVTLDSQAENDWLVATFGAYGEIWIGLTDQEVEGVWKWSNEPITYTNWSPGEPNNSGNEDFVVLNVGSQNWNDLSLSELRYGVIEAAPTPSALLLLGSGLAGLLAARKMA